MQQRNARCPLVASVRRGINVALFALCSISAEQFPGFLIISAPSVSKISWVRLPEGDNYKDAKTMTLIDSGLSHPQGIAIDQKRKRLYVADPGLRKVFAYQLRMQQGELTTDGKQTVIAQNKECRWVAVDGVGNIFFSDEPSNLILKVSADKVLRGDMVPEVVYAGHSMPQVNEPGGIAIDNFHLYWTNKHFGSEVGSVIRGLESPLPTDGPGAVQVLAKNTRKSYGVCLALGNVYYTDAEKYLYGTKKTGTGPIVAISSELKRPRGCVWDGDGTVYVADRAQNAVYAFAGNMHELQKSKMSRAFEAEDAFGVAVMMNSGSRRWASFSLVACIIAALMPSIF